MKITKRQLRRLIREHQGTLNEGVWEYVTDYVDPSGWVFSGAGAGIDEDELKSIASPDAWILFKALGGLGTDEDAVVKVIDRRAAKPGGLKKLSAEFDQLRSRLVEMRGSAKANILQGILGFVGGAMASSFRSKNPNAESLKYIEPTTAAGMGAATIARTAGLSPGTGVNIASATSASAQVGINKLMQTLQDRDLATWLASDGMEREAQMVRQAVQGVPAMASNMGESRKIRLAKRQLRRLIREWASKSKGDMPPSFRQPLEGPGVKVQFADVEDPHEKVPTRRRVIARIIDTGEYDGGDVLMQGDPVHYDSAHSGDKMARLAYEKARINVTGAYEKKYGQYPLNR